MRQTGRRDAAYIVNLLPTSFDGFLGEKGLSDHWRDEFRQELRKKFKNLRPYDKQALDQRVKVHLEEITPSNDEISINDVIKWQRIEARRLHTRLKKGASVLDVFTDSTFRNEGFGTSNASADVQVRSVHPLVEHTQMGPYFQNTNEAELATLLRGLQIVRNTFQNRGESKEFCQYKRIIVATSSIMSLQTLNGSATYRHNRTELRRATRIAAMCKVQAHEILKTNRNIKSIHFIWLPQLKKASQVV